MLILATATIAHAEDRARARRAFAEGRQHFDLGEYEQALESFKTAYRNYEEPTFLFNIAQCQRQLGNKEEAVAFYRKYLSKQPAAPNRADVQSNIDKLNAAIAAEREAKTAKTAPPPPEPEPRPIPDRTLGGDSGQVVARAGQPERTPLTKKWWLWAGIGGAVVAVALGVGLGVGLQPHDRTATTDFGNVRF
jgi:tetratricopeptide (TPR) repeat protein